MYYLVVQPVEFLWCVKCICLENVKYVKYMWRKYLKSDLDPLKTMACVYQIMIFVKTTVRNQNSTHLSLSLSHVTTNTA